MINQKEFYLNNSIKKILADSVILFKKTGLEDLAEKWEKILRNYISSKNLKL
jgi:hypothetical protein